MPKYRLLTQEELQGLEKEFIDYLILNGIVADDWAKMKEGDPEKAHQIIDLFSDVVFEGVLRKVAFLDHITPHQIRVFQCLPEKIILVGMQAPNHPEIDFTNSEFIKKAMSNPPASLKVYTSEKAYSENREAELFKMTENGCLISDGSLFKTLSLLLARDN